MKKCISIILSLVLVFGHVHYIARADVDEQQYLKNYICEYMNFLDSSLSELVLDREEALKYYESEDSLDYVYLDALIQHRKMQMSDLKYESISNVIDIQSIEKKDDVYNVEAVKESIMKYNCMDGEISEEIEFHDLIIEKKAETFIIVCDENYDEMKHDLGITVNEDICDVKAKVSTALSKEKDFIAQEKNKLEQAQEKGNLETEEIEKEVNNNETGVEIKASSFTKHSYNRSAAKTYALKYVLSPNSKYANFEKDRGNCTNFTSQCLYAGGIKKDKTGNYKWYYESVNDRAPAWTSANHFRNYYKNNVGSSSIKGLNAKSCKFEATRLGDLAQKVVSGKAKHTMFISGYLADNWASDNPWKYKYDVTICQNSTSKSGRLKNVPLSSRYSLSSLEYIHINGCYY